MVRDDDDGEDRRASRSRCFRCAAGPAASCPSKRAHRWWRATVAPLRRASPSFRGLHGCTRSQARLAALVVDGTTLRDAAQRMGITYGSARVYLKTVFHKVGVRSQAQLVAAAPR